MSSVHTKSKNNRKLMPTLGIGSLVSVGIGVAVSQIVIVIILLGFGTAGIWFIVPLAFALLLALTNVTSFS
ncbi:hypothetical protein GKC56_05325 [Neisseriaceae bacterium PsAf]|nr:hypothetical protein [Neisseriaceae bacterium PsAf]